MDQFDAVYALFQIIHLLQQEPDGLSTSEIGERLRITRQTALKYIEHLDGVGLPIRQDGRNYYLDPDYRLLDYLSPADGELLALLVERFQQTSLGSQPGMTRLLDQLVQKLPGVLSGTTPRGSVKATEDDHRVFERLVEAKHKRRWVRLTYRAPNAPELTEWYAKPYSFVLPVWSDGMYLICEGRRENRREQRMTLKLSRIQTVTVLRDSFDLPAVHTLQSDLRSAWGVWQSSQPAQHVVLRFHGRLHDRLVESVWHPSQIIRRTEDDAVIWEAEIAEPREMIPWIRGWGPDVEVLEPQPLRELIARDYQRAASQYSDLPRADESALAALWAKYDRTTRLTHALVCHLLDVSAVAVVLWRSLAPGVRRWVCSLLDLPDNDAMHLCAYLAGLHDVGKAAPAFQWKAEGARASLAEAGFSSPAMPNMSYDHGSGSAAILRKALCESIAGLSLPEAHRLAVAVGGHHGQPVTDQQYRQAEGARGDGLWRDAQSALVGRVQETLGVLPQWKPLDDHGLNLFAIFMAGFTTLADWVGSNENYFTFQPAPADDAAYFNESLQRAETALDELGWVGWLGEVPPRDFGDVFSFEPNPQQAAVLAARSAISAPALIIIEAPTGIGKTELALHLADQAIREQQLAGLYIAMPTQATSNQMYQRTVKFVESAWPDQRVGLLLAHGQAEYNHDLQRAVAAAATDGTGVIAEEWFTSSRKRRLLSPYAVGTVDQALLGVLEVRHFFLRLFALAGKAVIFDEVHAYDTYMSQLFERLLEWLTAFGSPVILLSATLPERVRRAVADRLIPGSGVSLPAAPYPRATFLYPDRPAEVIALPRPVSRQVTIEHLGSELPDLITFLTDRLADGGCAAVLCNTVREAQGIFRALENSGQFGDDELSLFHAQYPPVWREPIETEVLERFGKAGNRPIRAVLVATQVIEQSLDLDFDVMVSSTAPIDLLIQRMGRLHRHPRIRPPRLMQPALALRAPQISNGIPSFGSDEWVYGRYPLLQTWWLVRDRLVLTLPDEIDALIEQVYPLADEAPILDDVPEPLALDLRASFRKLVTEDRGAAYKASLNLIRAPGDESLFAGLRSESDDEDDTPQPATRLSEQSVRVLCLHQLDSGWSLDPDTFVACPLDRQPTGAERREMMRYTLTIRNNNAVEVITALESQHAWSRAPQLKELRVLRFTDGVCHLSGKVILRLSKRYGLEFEQGKR